MKQKSLYLISALLLTLIPAPASGSQAGAKREVIRLARALDKAEFKVRSARDLGIVERGKIISTPIQAQPGLEYKIIVSGCEDAFDLDVILFAIDSETDKPVILSKDTKVEKTATLHFSVKQSIKLYVAMIIADCTPDKKAHITLTYGTKAKRQASEDEKSRVSRAL
ncbi:MAG: hypothetical protein P1U89_03235 [Verrucomicrobiales bacterium]|nr:hypothetical protein [Verrucomicrobiales bacterium]